MRKVLKKKPEPDFGAAKLWLVIALASTAYCIICVVIGANAKMWIPCAAWICDGISFVACKDDYKKRLKNYEKQLT